MVLSVSLVWLAVQELSEIQTVLFEMRCKYYFPDCCGQCRNSEGIASLDNSGNDYCDVINVNIRNCKMAVQACWCDVIVM